MSDEPNKADVDSANEDLDDLDIFSVRKNDAMTNRPLTQIVQDAGSLSGILAPSKSSVGQIQPEKEVQYTPHSEQSGVMEAAALLTLTDGITLDNRFVLGKLISCDDNLENRFAIDQQTNITVTVHIPVEAVQHDNKRIGEIRSQCEAIAKLQHTHIVPLVGTFTDVNFGFFYVRKYITGKTLNEYRRDYVKSHGAFPVSQAVHILTDVADALDYANAQGVVHRELRPSNIVVSSDKGIQITNFPLTIETQSDAGNPYQASEEKWDGYSNAKSNQYVLAVIAYELITGHRGASTADMDFAPLPLPEIPRYVVEVVRRATSRMQDDRYENCQEFIHAIAAQYQIAVEAAARAKQEAKKRTILSSSAFWITVTSMMIIVAVTVYILLPQNTPIIDTPLPPMISGDNSKETDAVADSTSMRPRPAVNPSLSKRRIAVHEDDESNAETQDDSESSAAKGNRTRKEAVSPEMDVHNRQTRMVLTRQDIENHPNHRPAEGKIDKTEITIDSKKYVFCWVAPSPEGFSMGSPQNEAEHQPEEQLHQVRITRGFYLSETEVTHEFWEQVMPGNPSNAAGSVQLPVENVSWEDAVSFVKEINKRGLAPAGYQFALPTETQWEYACRAGQTTPFSFGYALNGDLANCAGTSPYNSLAPDGIGTPGPNPGKAERVKSYPPNAWGLYDMHGNVAEWCSDWFGEYPEGTVEDPQGPSVGISKVMRGGSWGLAATYCRSACRRQNSPSYHDGRIGIRLAIVPKQ